MNRKDQKLFLLGLGAQKAGSTWLHAVLSADRQTDFGPLKEYHVWDALDLPEQAHYDMRRRGELRNASESLLRAALGKPPSPATIRARFQSTTESYFEFFAARLARRGIRVTGDITPAYSGLQADRLHEIRERFAARGIQVKVVFVMRDPVDRMVSAALMSRRKGKAAEGVPLDGDLDSAVLAYAQSAHARFRGDYPSTVQTLRRVFPEDALHFGIFETMREAEELARLTRFAWLAPPPMTVTERKVNAHPKTESVSDATRILLRSLLDDTYVFCAKAFPETRHLWMPGQMS